jgi:hypothetical protein
MSRVDTCVEAVAKRRNKASIVAGASPRKVRSVGPFQSPIQRPRHRRERRLVCAAARMQRRRARTWRSISSGRAQMRSMRWERIPCGGDERLRRRPDRSSIKGWREALQLRLRKKKNPETRPSISVTQPSHRALINSESSPAVIITIYHGAPCPVRFCFLSQEISIL